MSFQYHYVPGGHFQSAKVNETYPLPEGSFDVSMKAVTLYYLNTFYKPPTPGCGSFFLFVPHSLPPPLSIILHG